MAILNCVVCQSKMFTVRENKKYCSDDCRKAYWYPILLPENRVERKCLVCEQPMILDRTRKSGRYGMNRIHCSPHCARKSARLETPLRHLATGTVGAIAELMVSVDLMRRGFEVFRALSPSCSCDLLAFKGDKIFKVEVRTGHERKTAGQRLSYPTKDIRAPYVAVVIHEKGKIVYLPDLSST